MTLEFRFPDVGEGITEGQVLKWLVKEGKEVSADQPVVEIETGKAVVEIPCPKNGKVSKFMVKEGQTVKVGEVLFLLQVEGEEQKQVEKKEEKKVFEKITQKLFEKKRESFGVVGELEEAPPVEITAQPKSTPHIDFSQEKIIALPATRKLAKDLGVDISKLKGSGEKGRVTSEDVQKFVASSKEKTSMPVSNTTAPQVNFDKYGRILSIPLTQTRKEIAKTMSKSMYSSPHAVAMEEIDVTEIARVKGKEKVVAENKGIHLTFLAFIVKACVAVLKDHSYLNAFFDEEKQQIIVKQYYNIGIAVDTPQGLVVPNVKDAVKKSILDVAHDIEMLAQKARDRTISLEELKGGTFTITNFGSIAGTFGVPIINYGESAILGIGRVQEKPAVLDGKIVIRKIMPVSLSFDHRVVDGAQAAEFLANLKKHLEDPDFLMVEMD